MSRRNAALPAFVPLGAALVLAAWTAVAQPRPVGWIEEARLYPGGFPVVGKLDSGADISALDARDLRYFEREGQPWVGFAIPLPDGSRREVERPVRRTATIRRPGGSERRPVVELGLCVAGIYAATEVSLADRAGFDYPLLVGRAFLAGRLVVDTARQRTAPPDCPDAPRE